MGRFRGQLRRGRVPQALHAHAALRLPPQRRLARLHQAQGQAADDGASQSPLPSPLRNVRVHGACSATATLPNGVKERTHRCATKVDLTPCARVFTHASSHWPRDLIGGHLLVTTPSPAMLRSCL
eukprot:2013589-Pleurochrysis_carterae.AAC.1